MIEIVRDHAGRVKRWSSGEMALRWAATGMLAAKAQFRCVKGYQELPALAAALERATADEPALRDRMIRHGGPIQLHDERDHLRHGSGRAVCCLMGRIGMTEERHALIVPLMQRLEPDQGGQAGRSRMARGGRWGKRLRQALAGPIEIPPDVVPIVEPFLAGLGVAYAFDMPYGYEMLGPRHCTELGVPPEALRGLALANLRMRRPEQTLFQATDAMAIGIELGGEFGGDLEASLVLDDEFMTRLAERFSGDLVVAIPDRDMLVGTGTGHADGLAKLQSIVDEIWPGADHPLAQRMLVRHAGQWQLLEMA